MAGKQRFVICLRNEGYEASLERHKIYKVLPDVDGDRHKQVRVVDEPGEDCLYPAEYFAPLELPHTVRRAAFAPSPR